MPTDKGCIRVECDVTPARGDPSAVAAARSATLSPQRRQDEQRSGADPEHAHDLRIDAPGRSNGPDRRIVTELVIRAFRTVGVDWPPVQAGFGALEPSLQRQRLNTVAAGVADKHPGHKSMVGAQAASWMRIDYLIWATVQRVAGGPTGRGAPSAQLCAQPGRPVGTGARPPAARGPASPVRLSQQPDRLLHQVTDRPSSSTPPSTRQAGPINPWSKIQ